MGMLNYETLLSSYDDKLTLMQWLKKVEAALKNASATAFSVNKKGNATISFSLTFEDGTSLESGDIVLQQGESVQSAYIQNGNLHLVLTNGDDLDAGNMFNGNVTINGNFEVTGRAKLPNIEGDENNNINVDGNVIITDGGISVADGAVSTPILTSENEYIEAQKPVIETMAGYSFNKQTYSNIDLNYLYAGAVKNGNKLTLCISLKITKRSGALSQELAYGTFDIPYEIFNKLIPVTISGQNVLDTSQISLYSHVYASISGNSYIRKSSYYGRVSFSIDASIITNMVEDTEYYIRKEITFLLGDNLAA